MTQGSARCGPIIGRTGQQVARIAMKDPEMELKLINASYDAEYLAYTMKYDYISGRFIGNSEVDSNHLAIHGQKVALSHTRDSADIPFQTHGAEHVCESTSVFLTTETVQPHFTAGVEKMVFSVPAKDSRYTVITDITADRHASGAMVKCINDTFGIKRGLMTILHAITASRPTVDGAPETDGRSGRAASGNSVSWRSGRAAFGNSVSSSTGFYTAPATVIPDFAGYFTGTAFIAPIIDVSVIDFKGSDEDNVSVVNFKGSRVAKQQQGGPTGGPPHPN